MLMLSALAPSPLKLSDSLGWRSEVTQHCLCLELLYSLLAFSGAQVYDAAHWQCQLSLPAPWALQQLLPDNGEWIAEENLLTPITVCISIPPPAFLLLQSFHNVGTMAFHFIFFFTCVFHILVTIKGTHILIIHCQQGQYFHRHWF